MLTKRQQPLRQISYECYYTNKMQEKLRKDSQNQFSLPCLHLLKQIGHLQKVDFPSFRRIFTQLFKRSQILRTVQLKTRNQLFQTLWKVFNLTRINALDEINQSQKTIKIKQLKAILSFTTQLISGYGNFNKQNCQMLKLTKKYNIFNGINSQLKTLLTQKIFKICQQINIQHYSSRKEHFQATKSNKIEKNLKQSFQYKSIIGKSKKLKMKDLQFSFKINVNDKQHNVNVFKGDTVQLVMQRVIKSKIIQNDLELRLEVYKMIEQLGIEPQQ